MTINYSIIIPHKNTPILLQRCIDSIPIRNDLEIIIVDDNSNSTIVNFNKFPGQKRKNTQVIFTKEGKGAGYARNIGVNHAIGKWILFADADDFFLDNFDYILDLYKYSDANVILFKTQCRLSDNIAIVGNRQSLCSSWNEIIEDYIITKNNPQLLLSKVIVPWGKMIQKNFLQKHNITFEEIPYANDVIWSTYIAIKISSNDFIASPHTIYCLTESPNSLYNNKNSKSFLIRFEVLHRQKKILKNYKLDNNESINYPYYLNQAQKLGLTILMKSIYIAIIYSSNITPIYNIERKLHFKYPFFYFIIISLQCALNKIKQH